MAIAIVMELLQGLTPGHSANVLSDLGRFGGILTAMLLVEFMIGVRNKRIAMRQ
jgi:hypothetical protein